MLSRCLIPLKDRLVIDLISPVKIFNGAYFWFDLYFSVIQKTYTLDKTNDFLWEMS